MDLPDLPDVPDKKRAALYVGIGVVGIALVFIVMRRRSTTSTSSGAIPTISGAGTASMSPPDSSSGLAGLSNAVAQQGQMLQSLSDAQGSGLTALSDSLTAAQSALALQVAENQRQVAAALASVTTGPGSTHGTTAAATPGGNDVPAAVTNVVRATVDHSVSNANGTFDNHVAVPNGGEGYTVVGAAHPGQTYGVVVTDGIAAARARLAASKSSSGRLDQMTPGGPSHN